MALLALSFSTAGVAYAASIGSADIIDNTIQSIDLKDGAAVKSADVVNDTLIGADINEVTLNGVARKLLWIAPASTAEPLPYTTLATVAGYDIKARCDDIGTDVFLEVALNGPAGDLQATNVFYNSSGDVIGDPGAGGGNIPPGTNSNLLTMYGDATFTRSVQSAFIHSGTTLVELQLHAVADNRVGFNRCFLYGSATKLA